MLVEHELFLGFLMQLFFIKAVLVFFVVAV
jgi:hypothetical protein